MRENMMVQDEVLSLLSKTREEDFPGTLKFITLGSKEVSNTLHVNNLRSYNA